MITYEDNSIFALDPNNRPAQNHPKFHHEVAQTEKVRKTGEGARSHPLLSTALPAYSTWKTRPSGEKVVTDRSYPVPMLLMVKT